MKLWDIKRENGREKGVLLPVFSLPSGYGIGCFSKEAREFIDWLHDTGHTYWQILPLNPTGNADSPYQPLSSFAGNAYFIDPAQLVQQGLLTEDELAGFDFGSDPSSVDYETLYDSRMEMLRLAHGRFEGAGAAAEMTGSCDDPGAAAEMTGSCDGPGTAAEMTGSCDDPESAAEINDGTGSVAEAYRAFVSENADWLEDYALFMALRDVYGKELSWDEWPEDLRIRKPSAMEKARGELAEQIGFYCWTQFEFYRQWDALKRHANAAGIRIIGDMPIYVSYDSSDCWADPEQFQLDEERQPAMIAGVPPDDFAEEGQLWGNPLYDWEKLKADGYRWWIRRMQQSFQLYDVIRLDHFRGFESYYAVEADAENALYGVWNPGPGMDLFRAMAKAAGCTTESLADRFIAEDLGFLTEGVRKLLSDSGFPGTKVLQFAFDGDPDNVYLPENYKENCVVYTGTHDNNTTAGWFDELSGDDQAGILQYLGYSAIDAWKLVLEYAAAEKFAAEDAVAKAAAEKDPAEAAAAEKELAEAAAAEKDPAEEMASVPDPCKIAAEALVKKALDSRARIAIIPLQDYYLLGSEARVNVPGTVGDNWKWRIVTL